MKANPRQTILELAILAGILLAPGAVSGQSPFRRGDSNSDGVVDVSDGD